jgi:hypothetical protein
VFLIEFLEDIRETKDAHGFKKVQVYLWSTGGLKLSISAVTGAS